MEGIVIQVLPGDGFLHAQWGEKILNIKQSLMPKI